MLSFARLLSCSVGLGFAGCANVALVDRDAAPTEQVAEPESAFAPAPRQVLAPGWSSVGLGQPRVVAKPAAVVPVVAPVRTSGTPVATSTTSRRTLQSNSGSFARKVAAARLSGLKLEGQTTLREVMQFLVSSTGLNFYVDPEAEDAFLDSGSELNLEVDRALSLTSALDLITDFAGDDVAWTIRHGVVYVTTPEKARGKLRTTVFDISDLMYAPPSYVGREMNVAPSGGLLAADEDVEERGGIVDESRIIDLIRATIAPGTWDDGRSSIAVRGGKLFVTHD